MKAIVAVPAVLLAAALAGLALAPHARAQSPAADAPAEPFAREYTYMLSAGEVRSAIEQGDRQMVIGYVAGVMDAQMRQREFCIPAGANPGVIGANAFTLMSQQPRESKAPAADVVAVYLQSNYPCKR